MSMVFEPGSPLGSVVITLMFDYEALADDELQRLSAPLPMKLLRWIAMNHPDNRTRKKFFRMTNVTIGAGTVLNAGLTLVDEYRGLVSFGERVAVAQNVSMVASSNPNNSRLAAIPYVQQHLIHSAPIHVGNDAWIGAHAVVLPGVRIGEHAVIGSGAVVVRDVAPFSIVAGVPAREIRVLPHAPDGGISD